MGIGCVVIVLGCGTRKPQPPPGLDEVQLAGWKAYVDLNCASCHGEDREGKRSGPPLTELAEHWTPEDLVSYLEDPDAAVRSKPRLAYRAEKYAIGMPKVSGKTPGYADKAEEETLRALAEYLLVDMQQPAGG
jgi:mono/diheme cytochrome c family protein